MAVILGGQGKGQNFAELAKPLSQFASNIYLIGEDADKIQADLQKGNLLDTVKVIHCQTLQNAVKQGFDDAKAQADLGVLLLSPACASFDQFSGYVERGKVFAQLVV